MKNTNKVPWHMPVHEKIQ